MVTQAQIDQYRQEGFFILESVIETAVLNNLRAECQRFVTQFEKEMEEKGVDKLGINHYKKRYFIAHRRQESETITQFLFGDLMAEITRAVLGENVYLFHEQYVVKAADKKTKFGWHQDSGYVGHYHKPYLSCWCALDDMSAANGTISILPYSRAGMKPDDLFDHEVDEESNDKVGYKGDDLGDLVEIPAGSIAVFSSRTFHKSGANTTDKMRRSYLAQYSYEPILNKEGTAVQNQAEPFWQDGVRIKN